MSETGSYGGGATTLDKIKHLHAQLHFCVLNANCPALPLMQPSPCVLSAPVRSQAAGRFPEPVALALAREAATATPGNAVWDRSAGSGAKKRYSASPWTPVVVWGDLQGEPQPFSQYSIFHLEV